MIEIVSRWDKSRVLYRGESAQDVRAAVIEAREKDASLRGADLRGADLRGADLRGADLWGADLGGADLRGADLRGADLWGADLGGADLGGADLRGADLRGADLRGADLRGASLQDADLRGADLRGAKGAPIVLYGLPSGPVLLHLADGVWQVRVGCWTGTPDELETLIEGDDWPEAEGDEQERRRPALTALVALCRAHIGYVEATGKGGNQ